MDSKVTKFDKNMSAVTFAEAGEFETAAEFLQEERTEKEAVNPIAKKKPYAGMVISGAVSLFSVALLCWVGCAALLRRPAP